MYKVKLTTLDMIKLVYDFPAGIKNGSLPASLSQLEEGNF